MEEYHTFNVGVASSNLVTSAKIILNGSDKVPKALDITGQRFGKLLAIKKVNSKNGKTYWLCQCDCGEYKEIQTCHLTSGVTQSCGKCKENPLFQHQEKTCILCKEKFMSNNIKRLYCYNCIPEGLNSTESIRLKKRKLKEILVQYKGGKCSFCGYDKCLGALQFHHLDPTKKDFTISQVNLNETNFSIDMLKTEVDKCILLCANCHAEEHWIKD